MAKPRKYAPIIERIFHLKHKPGMREVDFERDDVKRVAKDLNIELPENIYDLPYSFRFRAAFPASIMAEAGEGEAWIIRVVGRAKYRFVLVPDKPIVPNEQMVATKVPDATPGIIAKYALDDEQALLAKLRYNRLIDIFLGIACYSLQNHLRTSVPISGQVETDELYVGIDRRGAHYVVPVQAKRGKERLGIVQIEQDIALCESKFSSLICRPVAAQFARDDVIALFEFEQDERGLGVSMEKHYKLVPPEDVSEADLELYGNRLSE
jgi:hypothetical protein